MIQKMIVAFGLVSLSLLACAAQSEGTEEQAPGTASQGVTIRPTPGSGESCHAVGAGITNGTMTNDGWCCGVSLCVDKDVCGKELGHLVPACAVCDWYKCDPGATRVGGTISPGLLNHRGGKLELLSTDPADPGYALPYRPLKVVKE